MPNAAKFGLILGVSLVIAIGAVFFRKEIANAQLSDGPNAVPAPKAPSSTLPAIQGSTNQSAKATVPAQNGTPGGNSNLRYHTVREGDTLYGLAQAYYGDGDRFIDIYRQNRSSLRSPDNLPVGTVLVIPDLQAGAYANR